MSSGGQIAGGLIGGVIGFFNPVLGWQVGAQVGIMLGGLLDPPKGPTMVGPRLSDLTIQTSTYGTVIPRVYGTVALYGNVFWLENNQIKETVVKKKSGGKGGSKTKTKTYVNYATFAVGLCKGPIVGVKRIWIKGELFYDAGSWDIDTITASNAAATGFAVYLGTDTQLPDTRIQATIGIENTPAWRGLAYIVFYDLPIAEYGETLAVAQVKVEVMQQAQIEIYPHQTFFLPSDKDYEPPVYDGAAWCVVDADRHATYSYDCLNWTRSQVTDGDFPYSTFIATNGKGTILVGAAGVANLFRSTNHGVTWARVTVTTGNTLDYCAWNGSEFLMIEEAFGGSFHRSNDGLGWTNESPRPGGNIWPSSAFGNSLIWHAQTSSWYIFCNGNRTIYRSPSGFGGSWVAVYTAEATSNNFYFSCIHKGRILFSGVGTVLGLSQSSMIWSDDGLTWTHSAVPIRGQMTSDGDNLWVIANRDSRYSSDGVTGWTAYTPPAQGATNTYWVGSNDGFVIFTPREGVFGFLVQPVLVSPTPGQLSAIVHSECMQSGILHPADINTAALTSTVRGYTVASRGSIRGALTRLAASWPFDVVQSGYTITFVPRGGASVVTIDQDDLDARGNGAEPGIQATLSREMDTQLPRRMVIKYLDYDREFDVGEQYAERLNTDSVHEETQEIAIVLTGAEAAGKAEVLLFMRWLERFDLAFNLPPTYNQLEPADVVTLETPEGNVLLRLTAINYTSDGRLECRAKYADQAVYTPAALGVSPVVTGPTTIASGGPSQYLLLDVPYLHTAQSDPGFLAAMYGVSANWRGGLLIRTDDAGTTWNDLQSFDPPGSDIGVAADTIGTVDSRAWDKGSTLSVTMLNGSLSSTTELAVLNGENYFAYGNYGRWEIIGVQNCALVSGKAYALYDMLRGRAGTEWAMGTHQIGDLLVSLTLTDVTAIGMSAATIGLSREYRGITYGKDIDTDIDFPFAYTGVNLKCLSPVYARGYKTVATNDWNLQWVRRSRTDGEWRDLVDAGLSETSEAYEVYIFETSFFETIKRTIPAATQSCVYTAAQQVADFGSNQATIYWKVAQISSVVGPGYLSVATTST
jgi:hypothetical protein